MLTAFIPEFLRYLRFEKRMSENTYVGYQQDLGQFSEYLREAYSNLQDVKEIELMHIRSWMVQLAEEKKAQPRTLQRKSSSLKSFFKYLLRNNVISNNPATHIRTPKPARRIPVYLEEKDSEKILSFRNDNEDEAAKKSELAKATEQLIIEMLYQTGMRRAELCNLKESDIEYSRGQIRVLGKRNKERMIPAAPTLLTEIRSYTDLKRKIFNLPTTALLCTDKGKAIYPNYIYRVVTHHLKDTHLARKSPHVMRHTFATQLSNNGADLNAIKELLGHSSLAATQIYTHSNIEKLKEQYRKAHPKS